MYEIPKIFTEGLRFLLWRFWVKLDSIGLHNQELVELRLKGGQLCIKLFGEPQVGGLCDIEIGATNGSITECHVDLQIATWKLAATKHCTAQTDLSRLLSAFPETLVFEPMCA